jgi:hypothetical protein
MSRAYRLRSLPSTFIVDRRGVIRQIFFGGPLSEETLAAAVAPLLTEAPQPREVNSYVPPSLHLHTRRGAARRLQWHRRRPRTDSGARR